MLAPGGRAAILLTRVAAARVPLFAPPGLRHVGTRDVVVGGFPTAVVTLRREADGAATTDAAPIAGGGGGAGEDGRSGFGGENGGEGGGGGGHGALSSDVCCAVEVSEALSELSLSELLQQARAHTPAAPYCPSILRPPMLICPGVAAPRVQPERRQAGGATRARVRRRRTATRALLAEPSAKG